MPHGKKVGGRKKGVPNKINREGIDRVNRILSIIEEEYLPQDIKDITSAQRISLYADLIEYIHPKLARTEHTGKLQNVNYNIELSKKEMEEITKAFQNDY